MLLSNDTPGGPRAPLRRQPKDQKDDMAKITKNVMGEAYTEWPNEAGFSGLVEERGPIEIPVHGTIPSWVSGSLYRTGPGQFEVPDGKGGKFTTDHWFDGLAQTHRFDIVADGDETARKVKVLYSSRSQSQELVQQMQAAGRRTTQCFGQRADPCLGLFAKFMAAWHVGYPEPKAEAAENICVTVQASLPGYEIAEGNLHDGSYVSGKITKAQMKTRQPLSEKSSQAGHRPPSLWLTSDSSSVKQVDPKTLEPIGFATQTALHPDLTGPLSCAHAQRCPQTGDLYNFNQAFGREVRYRLFRTSARTGETTILATIRGVGVNPAYIHSFFLSEHFAVLCIPSSHLMWLGLKVLWQRNVLEAIKPFDSRDAWVWVVVDRHRGGVVARFETEAGFFFHSVNAFEERDEEDQEQGTVSLYCDVIRYTTTEIMNALYLDVLTQKDGATQRYWDRPEKVDESNTFLVRYRVRVPHEPDRKVSYPTDLGSGDGKAVPELDPETIVSIPGPHAGELPTINPSFATRKTRYAYSLPSRGLSTLFDTIAKTDMETGEALLWNNPSGHTPGEAIFVARPGGTEEDDGVLLSLVLDGHAANSYLLVLDARTMMEMGRAEVGFALGLGFHGLHLPDGVTDLRGEGEGGNDKVGRLGFGTS